MSVHREAVFHSKSYLSDANFANLHLFAANVTFQGLVVRNTILYNTTSLVHYDVNAGYLEMPTVFTLNDTKIENVSQQGDVPSEMDYPGLLFYIAGCSALRVHRLYLAHFYAKCKNTYMSTFLILDRSFGVILPSQLCLF